MFIQSGKLKSQTYTSVQNPPLSPKLGDLLLDKSLDFQPALLQLFPYTQYSLTLLTEVKGKNARR